LYVYLQMLYNELRDYLRHWVYVSHFYRLRPRELLHIYISFLFRFHSILTNWLKFRKLTSDCCHPVGIPSYGALFWFDFRILRHFWMWHNIKIIGRRFRKVPNINVAFWWISPYFQFFLFEWRLVDWPWNVVILLGFQVPVPFFDLIFRICDTFRCETTLKFFADDSGKLWKWI